MAPRLINQQAPRTLAQKLEGRDRLPLTASLDLCARLVAAVSEVHDQGLVFGKLSTGDVAVQSDGSLHILATPKDGRDQATDIHALGLLLEEVLRQTNDVALVEHDITYVLSLMLEPDPAFRPSSLEVVTALLGDVVEAWSQVNALATNAGLSRSPLGLEAAAAGLSLVEWRS